MSEQSSATTEPAPADTTTKKPKQVNPVLLESIVSGVLQGLESQRQQNERENVLPALTTPWGQLKTEEQMTLVDVLLRQACPAGYQLLIVPENECPQVRQFEKFENAVEAVKSFRGEPVFLFLFAGHPSPAAPCTPA